MRKGVATIVLYALTALALEARASAQLHVAPTGSDAGAGTAASPFRTINHAASVAAPGSTILLHAGTYGNEQGIVSLGSKDLVLQGAGAMTTILVPHSASTVALPAADPDVPGVFAHRVGVLLAGTARVHLRDFTIDAQSTTAGHLAGVYLRAGVDVVCDHLVVRNCRSAVLGSVPAHAIVVRGDLPTDPTTLAMRDVAVTNFGTGAVRASFRAELDLQECRIAGAGFAASGVNQVGVWVQSVAIGVIRFSRITHCSGPSGTAIRFEQHGSGCVVEGNSIARAAVGVDLRHTPPLIVPGDVRHNRIASVGTTVAVRGVAGVFVNDNALFAVSRLDATPYFDNTAGSNIWSENRYGVPPGTTTVSIPGGSNVDLAPIASLSQLGAAERVACGGAPIDVVVADFDADGRDDFATLDMLGNGVGLTVALWRSSGWLVSSQGFGSTGSRPIQLATGSLDGRSGIDLVALTAPTPPAIAGGAFWVFANDGTGGMSLLHDEPLSGHIAPSSLAVGRFDTDFRDDVVVTDLGAWPFVAGRADRFQNDGTGAGWTAAALPIVFTGAAVSASGGDVDGDGNADVVLVEGTPSTGRMHWLQGDGFGGFAASLGSPFSLAPNPSRVVIADYDADGDRDIVVAAAGGPLPLQRGSVQIFENRPSVLFALPPMPVESGPAQLLVADLDDDAVSTQARPELVVLHPSASSATVLGAFERTTGFAGGGTMSLIDTPVALAAGDLDGDAWQDVVFAEPILGGVAVLHGAPTSWVRTYGNGCPGTSGREPRLELRGSPAPPVLPNPSFTIGLTDGFPVSAGLCAVALGLGPTLSPCGYLLDAPIFFLTTFVDANGKGAFGLPLHPAPDLYGLAFCVQAAVLDPAALTSIVPELSLTAALCCRIGD